MANESAVYAVKNLTSGNLVKDAISTKINYYVSKERAEKVAFTMNRFAAIDEKFRAYKAVKVVRA